MASVISLDDLNLLTFSVAASLYWPLMLGGAVLFLLLVNGFHKVTVPVVGVFVLLQGWYSDAFG